MNGKMNFYTYGMEELNRLPKLTSLSDLIKEVSETHYPTTCLKAPDPIKETKIFHTFNFKDRDITLCVLNDNDVIKVGYAVKNPEDKEFNEDLAKTISYNRAKSRADLLLSEDTVLGKSFLNNSYIYRTIAEGVEFKIRKNIIIIKGIR